MSCVCVLRPVSVFCVLHMLGANTMLGAMDNIEFINILSLPYLSFFKQDKVSNSHN